MNIITYNEQIVFPRLKHFIDQYFVKRQTQENFVEIPKKDIVFFHNNKVLKQECNEKIKLCALGLLDGRSNKKSVLSFERYMKTLETVANKKLENTIVIGWVNATCQVKNTFNLGSICFSFQP